MQQKIKNLIINLRKKIKRIENFTKNRKFNKELKISRTISQKNENVTKS
mgnify:CR=1 FL=1